MTLKYFLFIVCFGFTTSVSSQLKKIKIDGAELNYLDKGSGTPVIFVHGGMEDYRTWDTQIDSFSKYYRVITYSRRFNYPNRNLTKIKDFSSFTEAKDLAQ